MQAGTGPQDTQKGNRLQIKTGARREPKGDGRNTLGIACPQKRGGGKRNYNGAGRRGFQKMSPALPKGGGVSALRKLWLESPKKGKRQFPKVSSEGDNEKNSRGGEGETSDWGMLGFRA